MTLFPHLDGQLMSEEALAGHRHGTLDDESQVDVDEGVVHGGIYRDAAVTWLDAVADSKMSQVRRRKAGKNTKQQ